MADPRDAERLLELQRLLGYSTGTGHIRDVMNSRRHFDELTKGQNFGDFRNPDAQDMAAMAFMKRRQDALRSVFKNYEPFQGDMQATPLDRMYMKTYAPKGEEGEASEIGRDFMDQFGSEALKKRGPGYVPLPPPRKPWL